MRSGEDRSARSGGPSSLKSVKRRRDRHAMDHFRNFTDPVDSGVGERPRAGRSYSCPAGHRYHRVSRPPCSGTKSTITTLTLSGESEACEKEVVSGFERIQ